MEFETNMKKIKEYEKEFERYNRRRKSVFRKYFKICHPGWPTRFRGTRDWVGG